MMMMIAFQSHGYCLIYFYQISTSSRKFRLVSVILCQLVFRFRFDFLVACVGDVRLVLWKIEDIFNYSLNI